MVTCTHQIDNWPQRLIGLVIVTEAVLLLLMIKSVLLSVLLAVGVISAFIVILYPEFGLAVALTGNILLKILFDYIEVDVWTPVLMGYLILLGGGLVMAMLKHTHRSFRISKTAVIALLIGLLMLISLLYSGDRQYGMEKVTFYFTFNILLLLFPALFLDNEKRMMRLFLITFILGIALGLVSSMVAQSAPEYYRLKVSVSVNENWLSRSLGVSLICAFPVWVMARRGLTRITMIAMLPLFLYPMIRAGSRAPFLGLFGAVLLFLILQPKVSRAKKIGVSLMGLIAAAGIIILSGSGVTARISEPTVTDVASTAFRFSAWAQAIQHFIANPFTGIGTGSFEMILFWNVFKYPHNLFLEMACELGIAGLLLIVLFVYLALRDGFRNIRDYQRKQSETAMQLSITALVLLAYSLWNSMLSGAVHSNEIIWFSAGLIWVLRLWNLENEGPALMKERAI